MCAFASAVRAFLDQHAADVERAVGERGVGFDGAFESVFRALEIALQQQADAVIVPALPVVGMDLRRPTAAAAADRKLGFGRVAER